MRAAFFATTLFATAIVSGCVTTQGGGLAGTAEQRSSSIGLDTSSLTDFFSSEMRSVRQLIELNKFDEAEAAFLRDSDYFKQRLDEPSKEVPPFLQKLGEYVWAKHYANKVKTSTQKLESIDGLLNYDEWEQKTAVINDARRLLNTVTVDLAVSLLRQGTAEIKDLNLQMRRVDLLARVSRPEAIIRTHEEVLSSGRHRNTYPLAPFNFDDYQRDYKFQDKAEHLLSLQTSQTNLIAIADRLRPYLSNSAKETADKRFVDLTRQDLLADGKITLDELALLAEAKTPFGGATDQLSAIVKVGYVDLTSANLINRNIFDFEITFEKDLALTFVPADESVFRSGDWGRYDYLFVTDLALAKVSREFKSRNSIKSRVKVGEKETPNPAYVEAMTNYQRAMAEYQRTQISSAFPKACQGWGCALQGIADGLAEGAARNRVDQASRVLANTNQTFTIPVYAPYEYESVDINATKNADVNYYVIDVKGQRIIQSNFQVNDQEIFNVAYNVNDADPDKSSIFRNVKSEDEVVEWEKHPMKISLGALFSTKNLKTATSRPMTDVPTFLTSLSTYQAVPASPTYTSRTLETSTRAGAATTQSSTTGRDANTIADERFDSIVIIQTPDAIGTGFYITPDLILTAHHVVAKNSLVQIGYYNGSKSFGRLVNHDVRLDLALIRAQTPGKPLKIHAGPLRLGETVEAIGHPKGYDFTITRGVISALRRQRSSTIGSSVPVEFVQTDTPISPGNSGGPLLLGETVIGVNDWTRVDKGSQNLNFSVSFNEIREFLNRSQTK